MKKRITLVDDDPGIQETLRLMLELHGYELTVFDNAAPLLSGLPTGTDLFLLDRQLAGMDGLALCRFLKAQAATRDVPVLVLSASPQAGPLAVAAGADGFLEKPFKMQLLLESISRLAGAA